MTTYGEIDGKHFCIIDSMINRWYSYISVTQNNCTNIYIIYDIDNTVQSKIK